MSSATISTMLGRAGLFSAASPLPHKQPSAATVNMTRTDPLLFVNIHVVGAANLGAVRVKEPRLELGSPGLQLNGEGCRHIGTPDSADLVEAADLESRLRDGQSYP